MNHQIYKVRGRRQRVRDVNADLERLEKKLPPWSREAYYEAALLIDIECYMRSKCNLFEMTLSQGLYKTVSSVNNAKKQIKLYKRMIYILGETNEHINMLLKDENYSKVRKLIDESKWMKYTKITVIIDEIANKFGVDLANMDEIIQNSEHDKEIREMEEKNLRLAKDIPDDEEIDAIIKANTINNNENNDQPNDVIKPKGKPNLNA